VFDQSQRTRDAARKKKKEEKTKKTTPKKAGLNAGETDPVKKGKVRQTLALFTVINRHCSMSRAEEEGLREKRVLEQGN